jgi:GYF domain 2
MAEFWVIRDGERIGPFAEAEILRSYESGALQGSDLLWSPGMATGATVDEAFAQLRKAILTSSQPLALAEIAPLLESAVPPDASPPADAAVPAERSRIAAGGSKRGWLVALIVLVILALAFAAFQILA